MSFGTNLVGYIGGDDSTLLKSTDGGYSWTPQSTSGMQFTQGLQDIIQVDFIDALNGTAIVGRAPYSGLVYKTVDGGDIWVAE